MELDAPELDIVAGTNDDSDQVTVFIVNRGLEEVTAVLDLQAFEASGKRPFMKSPAILTMM